MNRIVFSLDRISSQAPVRATVGSAGFDLFADIHTPTTITPSGGYVVVKSGETLLIPTGVRTHFGSNIVGKVYARSGLSTKKGLRPANCVGVIDSDYPGEIMVPLYNDSADDRVIMMGDRIAQIIFEEIPEVELVLQPTQMVAALHESSKRTAEGFGSTGAA